MQCVPCVRGYAQRLAHAARFCAWRIPHAGVAGQRRTREVMALNFKHLCQLLDCRQVASLNRVMKARGIRWSHDRAGRPWTTEAELDRALSAPERKLAFPKPCRPKNCRRGS